MKSFLVVCVLLVVGSAECGRMRRMAFFGMGGPPKAPAPGAAPGAPSPAAAKSAGMNAALAPMVDELDKEKALGGPVNTAGLMKATILAEKIQLLGGEVDPATKTKMDGLMADFVQESTDFSGFMESAAKPQDTDVAVPGAPSAAAKR